jgi:exodeoxyribonuclease-3
MPRIVTWNAQMRFHDKLPRLVDALGPDVAVVAECAEPETLRRKGLSDLTSANVVWVGRNPNKGLSIFAFGDYKIELATCLDRRLEWVAPVSVTGPLSFLLLGVWAMNHRASEQHPDHVLRPQAAAALDVYRDWYAHQALVMSGDFNANVIWERRRSPARGHSETLRACDRAGLVSAYHAYMHEEQGEESIPTHYWRERREDGHRHHIDYTFLPQEWMEGVTSVEVGAFGAWVGNGLSDHVPLVVDVSPVLIEA